MDEWKRSRNESSSTVAFNLEFILCLKERSSRSHFQVQNLFRKSRVYFEKIDSFCKDVGVPSKLFLDVMLQSPVGGPKGEFNFVLLLFLRWASSRSGQELFVYRLEAYKKRLGALEEVSEYVSKRSPANIRTLFGESFVESYWTLHRILEDTGVCPDGTAVRIILEGTPIFVATSKLIQDLTSSLEKDDVLMSMIKSKAGPEMALYRFTPYRLKFENGRNTTRLEAQNYLKSREDERWGTIWTTLE